MDEEEEEEEEAELGGCIKQRQKGSRCLVEDIQDAPTQDCPRAA